jgi:hypothetical protein
MRTSESRLRRAATTAVLLVGIGALAVGAWVGGEPWLALMLAVFAVVTGAIAYVWAGGSGDVAALLRAGADERQLRIDARATMFAAYAMILFCVGGAVLDLARGGTGNPWALILAVGGFSYAAAFLPSRRH